MSKTQTITAGDWSSNPDDWLPNPHAGDMLWLEFMEPGNIGVDDLSSAIDLSADRIKAVIDGNLRMDAELDLRLARYFGMPEGFFLGLQIDYELLEAKRALNGQLDRIVPRAA